MHNHHITLLAKNYMVSLHDLSLHGEEMHQKWCPFPHFVGLATNFPFTLVTKFLFKRRGYWIYYCVLAIVYLLSSTIKVNKLVYLRPSSWRRIPLPQQYFALQEVRVRKPINWYDASLSAWRWRDVTAIAVWWAWTREEGWRFKSTLIYSRPDFKNSIEGLQKASNIPSEDQYPWPGPEGSCPISLRMECTDHSALVLRVLHAFSTPSLCLLCAFFAPSLRLLCAFFAPSLRFLCAFPAPALVHLYWCTFFGAPSLVHLLWCTFLGAFQFPPT